MGLSLPCNGCYNKSMNVAIQQLLDTALLLPERDRANLAASLPVSLDQPFDADARSAWAEEIGRRLAELDNGSITPIPWEEARRVIAGRV